MNRRRRLSNWRGTPPCGDGLWANEGFSRGDMGWHGDMGEAVETVRGWNLDLACMPQAGLRLDLQRVLHGQPSSALTADRRSPRCLQREPRMHIAARTLYYYHALRGGGGGSGESL